MRLASSFLWIARPSFAPALLGLAISLAFVETLAAQSPTPNTKLSGLQTGVITDLREKNFTALDATKFDAYFNEYFLPLLSNSEAKPMDLASLRHALRTRFLGSGKNGEPHARLVRLTFDKMKLVIQQQSPDDPKHVALKVSAMLMIAELNEREGEVGAKSKPLPAALAFMLRTVNDPREADYLRAPALLGVQRHCECFADFPPEADTRRDVAVSMLKLANEGQPPEDRDATAQAWLRRMALQNLGAIGAAGAEQATDVVDAFVAIIRDSENPMSVRCAAAAAIGDLKLAGVAGINAMAICNQLGELAVALAKRESDLARLKEEAPNIRRLKSDGMGIVLTLVGRDGKHGLMMLTPEPRRAEIETLAKRINELCGAKVTALSAAALEQEVLDLEKIVRLPMIGAAN